MAYVPAHRSAASLSQPNGAHTLLPPGAAPSPKPQQRRMTSPGSLTLPDSRVQPQTVRPPSPLRNGFIPDTSTGIDGADSDDDESGDDTRVWARSPSPASSVSQFAASFAQRVGSLVGGMAPRPPGMPTDAELEAEAERERDRSRREAERILTREAEERRTVEERVLAMMKNSPGASPKSLPQPPRSRTLSNPPSPANSQKEGSSWWTAAKNKLTPTKEPLTPAQQVIQEAKSREKEKKGKAKEKDADGAWPANSQEKFNDPAFLKLNIPVAPPQRRPVPTSPSSPTPSRPIPASQPPNLTPSPMRSLDGMSSSPSREAQPIYAQFNNQGTLDVPGTLLTIAKRFEKLEKWTVGHVRALEERMSDVERWLVDKEKKEQEREQEEAAPTTPKTKEEEPISSTSTTISKEVDEIKQEVIELQGRVGELGREMAKLATAPANLSSGPSREAAQVSVAPQTTSQIAVHSDLESSPPTSVMTPATTTTPHTRLASITARESTSPPMTSSRNAARSRLPYPSGDYATPPDTASLSQGVFSPASSPPSSITSNTRSLGGNNSISGLPGIGLGISQPRSSSGSSSGLPQASSPPANPARAISPTLPVPKVSQKRPNSISPTPRKRYTVALGGPITAPPELSDKPEPRRIGTPVSFTRPQSALGTAFFSSPPGGSGGGSDAAASDDDDDARGEFEDETIGKSAGRLSGHSASPSNSSGNPRIRAQSVYGLSSLQPPQTPITPLRPRVRSRSTDRFGLDAAGAPVAKFVDPLVLRKQENKIAMPKPVGKVPIGQLVAFFDGDKKERE